MRKTKIVSGVLATSVAVAATLGGCSLVSSNTSADMNQIIAEVNVAKAAALDADFNDYKEVVGTSTVIKRELVAYFLNVGYSYVQNYGYTYEQAFNTLMNSLVENEVLTQYATMYLLKNKAEEEKKTAAEITAEFKKFETASEKYEWLLGGKDSDDVKIAEYSLLSSINSAIDSYEKRILDDEDSSNGSATRSTPGGVDTEKEDFYPKKADDTLDYNVYTGYDGYLLSQSGVYEKDKLEGTTKATRIRAYNSFINSLASSSYDLVDKANEDLRDLRKLSYIESEYVSQLEQRVINKYYDLYEAEREELLKGEDYSYVAAVYDDLLKKDTDDYAKESSFSSSLSNMSDSSFILYAPGTENDGRFGFVYNILLPFSASQSARLKEIQSFYKDEDVDGGYKGEYYAQRNKLLKDIKTTDQRSAWFNGEKEYAFKPAEGTAFYNGGNTDREYLFFENNLENTDRYEAIEKYDGRYSYNGKVVEKDDGYVMLANTLDIDEMLTEFENYVNYVVGDGSVKCDKVAGYYDNAASAFYKDANKADEIDYSKLVYANGQIKFGDAFSSAYNAEAEAFNRANLLNKDSNQYKALSAVNELQYAYTTDTSVLSQYVGYSVEAGDTSYIKEFEYAAHEAVNLGAGHFSVCAGDYGWHIIYVTYTFDNHSGNQYTPDWVNNINVEGTFENLFYEMVKSNDIADISTTRRTQIITEFKSDSTVTTYESRYKDLLELDK